MEAKTFKIDNYINVPGFAIVEHKLSGNELLCYSLIYGFTQDEETEFSGSLTYVASALNITKQNAKKVIDRLLERGLLTKKEMYFSGVKFCHYVANRNSNGVAEIATGRCRNNNGGVAEIATGGMAETTTNNTIRHNSNDNIEDNSTEGALFPGMPESEKRKGTSEDLCLFANSRYFDKQKFMECFASADFAGIDILYYYEVVKDWSASKRTKKNDWIATTRNIMRRDNSEGKLHRLPDAGNNDNFDYEGFEKYMKM